MAAIGESHRFIDFCDDVPGTPKWKILRIEIMQLKGLAVKKTPIYADSAVIRYEQLSEDCKERGSCSKRGGKVKAMTFLLNQASLLRV